jgi:putative ABC transport system permease protein
VLLADLSPQELFLRLDDETAVREFDANLVRLKIPNPGVPRSRLGPLLLKERPELDAFTRKVISGHRAAIAGVQKAYPGRSPSDLAVSPPQDFSRTLVAAGFSFSPEVLPPLEEFAEREQRTRAIVKLLLDPEVRAAVARETRVPPGDVSFDVLLAEVTDERSAGWLLGVLAKTQPELGLDEGQLLSLLDLARRRQRLLSISGEDEGGEGALFGLSERSLWLIALSFMVCVVGVANAMLMSVTERFTEIATMKCLGAMDRFVMTMFVFEAVVQGVIGGLVGVVVGVVLALLRGLVEFGTLLSGGFGAPLDLTLGVLLSFLIGVVLAAAAAVGPSWIAARLPPMEAMRVE